MNLTTKAWDQFEAGRDYKRRIGLYARVRENERFYRGEQWGGVNSNGLPTPVFNIIKRVISYIISNITAQAVTVSYSDESLPTLPESANRERIAAGVELLNKNAAYRLDRDRIEVLIRQALLDAAISGNGVFYTYWESDAHTGQPYTGDFRTILCDNVNLFVSNVNSTDLQSQDYVMICGRDTVEHLCEEARRCSLSEREISAIAPDDLGGCGAGELFDHESSEGGGYATYLIKFFRGEDGYVQWEKSTRSVVLRRVKTTLRRYPVCYFSWESTKGSFIGNSPVTSLIENQKYVNKAYAMVMKHMTNTAFSKVVYDKNLIPDWTNEVGEAIGVRGGTDVRSAAAVIGTGNMQSGFLDVISMTMAHTKELMGATDAALGEVEPDNTSAILALQESSNIPLESIKQNLYACIEELALIWAEMLFEYYPAGRKLLFKNSLGEVESGDMPDRQTFRSSLLRARVDVGAATRFSQIVAVNALDKLLAGGYISFRDYLSRLPDGIISNKGELMEQAELAETKAREQEAIAAQTAAAETQGKDRII